MMRFLDKDIKNSTPEDVPASPMDDILRRLQPEVRRPKPSPEAIAAALESAQRLAAEADAENGAEDMARTLRESGTIACGVCGHSNREGTKFCGMCGVAMETRRASAAEPPPSQAIARALNSPPAEAMPAARANETHHYHHHYHHHYFPGADGMYPRASPEPAREVARDFLREEKLRPSAALRGEMTRAEAAVRSVTQEWVLACNTKHLDDLVELYVPDGIVLRSNCPPIRGATAVREFFFGAMDAGLGEVELEPLRVEVVGELAYEAGRFKALVPSATGKRREERGKYLWVCQRQSNSEWKVSADCWSSDLTLTNLESDVPLGSAVKTNQPRKL
jgi:ketosteroid isomerase-like protein